VGSYMVESAKLFAVHIAEGKRHAALCGDLYCCASENTFVTPTPVPAVPMRHALAQRSRRAGSTITTFVSCARLGIS